MMADVLHLTMDQLAAGLDDVRLSPSNRGVVDMIVRRPSVGEREILDECELDVVKGLAGDRWSAQVSANRDCQLTIMNSLAIHLIAQQKERWSLAGDQFFIDVDLSLDNLPPGTQLAIGSAVVEISATPHTGCKKFHERFGLDALQFVNSDIGRQLNLRGVNAKIIQSGAVRVGDIAAKRE